LHANSSDFQNTRFQIRVQRGAEFSAAKLMRRGIDRAR
jgi:hypothetical protein